MIGPVVEQATLLVGSIISENTGWLAVSLMLKQVCQRFSQEAEGITTSLIAYSANICWKTAMASLSVEDVPPLLL